MKEPIPSEFPSREQPRNVQERIQEINRKLRTRDQADALHIYDIYNAVEELDDVTGLVDKKLLFSGRGVVVAFEDGEPSDPRPFKVERLSGTSLGFDVWGSDDDEVAKVYLALRTGSVDYDDDGECVNGSIYFLDPLDSAITVIEASFDEIITDIADTEAANNDEAGLQKIIGLAMRYERMVKSVKFKELDELAKMQAVEKLLSRLNSCIDTLGPTVGVESTQAYLRDLQDGEVRPRACIGTDTLRGEPAAFVSLHAVMPEFCPGLRQDQLCLALAPDADTAKATNATDNQIVFVPIKKGATIIEEPLFNRPS